MWVYCRILTDWRIDWDYIKRLGHLGTRHGLLAQQSVGIWERLVPRLSLKIPGQPLNHVCWFQVVSFPEKKTRHWGCRKTNTWDTFCCVNLSLPQLGCTDNKAKIKNLLHGWNTWNEQDKGLSENRIPHSIHLLIMILPVKLPLGIFWGYNLV